MVIRIKCKFCDELVLNKSNHFCISRRSFIPCDYDSPDFNLAFVSASSVGELFTKSLDEKNN